MSAKIQLTAKLTPESKRALLKLKNIDKKYQKAIIAELEDTAIEIRNEAISSMRSTPKTGLTYPRQKGKKMHIASSSPNPPAVDRSDLIKSLIIDVRPGGGAFTDFEVEVGTNINDPPYGSFLEFGTVNMDKRPWLQPAIDKKTKFLESRLKRAIKNQPL